MLRIPDYSDPRWEAGEAADRLSALMRAPAWARRKWLLAAPRYEKTRFLYRYQDFRTQDALSMRKAEDFLVESRLFLATPSSFNDPYEFQGRILLSEDPIARRRYFHKVGKRMGLRGKRLNQSLNEFIRKTNKNLYAMGETFVQQKEKWGIGCFSKNPKSLRMWSHYSAGHSGICFQFDLSQDLSFAVQTLPVNYEKDIATLRWPEEQDRVLDDVLLRKWDVWAEEEEMRYASHQIFNSHRPLTSTFVSGLILGNKFPSSAMQALDDFLRRRSFRSLPSLKLYRAERYEDRYGMFIRKLNVEELKYLPHAV